jgi:DNA end-binding protein Ku
VTVAARSSWKGYLKFSLVSMPVKAYPATTSEGGSVRLNQLHADCHSRINYKKTCPVHGEVSNDAIVSGYEYAKGQYVIVDTDELEKLRSEDDKAIQIDTFIKPDTLDPVYYAGKSYYLVPDGPVGQKAYSVFCQAMIEENRQAVGQVVMHGREQVVLLRPMGGLLTMTVLNLEPQVTKPSAFAEEAPKVEASPEEMKLAKTLIDASTAKKFDFAKYKDVYTEKLTRLIEAKVAGEEIVTPPAEQHAQVINLMDALRQSVEKLKPAEPKAEVKPPRKMAPSTKGREAAPTRKKKTS